MVSFPCPLTNLLSSPINLLSNLPISVCSPPSPSMSFLILLFLQYSYLVSRRLFSFLCFVRRLYVFVSSPFSSSLSSFFFIIVFVPSRLSSLDCLRLLCIFTSSLSRLLIVFIVSYCHRLRQFIFTGVPVSCFLPPIS